MAHKQGIDAAAQILTQARTIAILGAHDDPARPAHYVPAYLQARGYRVLPVNPRFVSVPLFSGVTVASLPELREPIDIVDVFRPGAALPLHLDEILAMVPLPRVVWFQQGIENDEVADALVAVGIDVVQNRCTLADHRALGLPDVSLP